MYLCSQFGPLSDARCAGRRMVGAKRDAASERQTRDRDGRGEQDEGARYGDYSRRRYDGSMYRLKIDKARGRKQAESALFFTRLQCDLVGQSWAEAPGKEGGGGLSLES